MGLFAELKRRNVVRVAILYAIASWAILEAAEVIFGMLQLPAWAGRLILALIVLGFPVVLAVSWIYEITPEGLRKARDVPRHRSITALTARRLNFAIGIAAAIAIFGIVADRLIPERAAPAQATSAAGPPPVAAVSATAERSIAVLPFSDMSEAKDQQYFADGLSEELINLLARIELLRVIGRTSSFQFRGRDEDLRTIGAALDVAHLLQGSVRRSGRDLRITAQLIRADDGSQLWSGTYDRPLEDIFRLQDEIAADVVGALKLRLVEPAAHSGPQRRYSEAYNQYLQGRFQLERRTQESLAAAQAHFQSAIETDPGDALAWVGLAEAYASQTAYTGQFPPEDGLRLAREAATRALVIDPGLATAHAALGWIEYLHDWDWAAADARFSRALQLAPGDAQLLVRAATLDFTLGRYLRAAERQEQAIARDPLRARWHYSLALTRLAQGRNRDAEAGARRALSLDPAMAGGPLLLAESLLLQRRFDDAEQALSGEPDAFWKAFGRALVEHAQGRRREADAALEELKQAHGDFGPFQVAEVHAFRGQADLAFRWLDQAYRERDAGVIEMLASPLLRPLKSDPRFAAMARKRRLPLDS